VGLTRCIEYRNPPIPIQLHLENPSGESKGSSAIFAIMGEINAGKVCFAMPPSKIPDDRFLLESTGPSEQQTLE
jgi:hypothetical protein